MAVTRRGSTFSKSSCSSQLQACSHHLVVEFQKHVLPSSPDCPGRMYRCDGALKIPTTTVTARRHEPLVKPCWARPSRMQQASQGATCCYQLQHHPLSAEFDAVLRFCRVFRCPEVFGMDPDGCFDAQSRSHQASSRTTLNFPHQSSDLIDGL